MRRILLLIVFFTTLQQTFAQSVTAIQLELDSITVEAVVPEGWTLINDAEIQQVEARSEESFYAGGTDLVRAVFRLENPDRLIYGDLPEADRIGALMEVVQAGLPATADFPPQHMTPVKRFEWGEYPAALFLTYSTPEPSRPAYYAQWYGIELSDEAVLMLQLGMTLPAEFPPSQTGLETLRQIRNRLRVNGDKLPDENVELALGASENPIPPLIPVASMRLRDGVEVRLPAPENWFRQDVTQEAANPVQYFFEDDPREIAPGEEPAGAVVLASLIAQSRIEAQLGAMPEAGTIAIRYAAYLLENAAPGLADAAAEPLMWGDYPAVYVTAQYPAEIALHRGGTVQEMILLEADNSLILITIYTPESRWTELTPLWQNMLGGLLINGKPLPEFPANENAE